MECETEGIYASAELKDCSGLTLPPKIQSNELWLSETTICLRHDEFAVLLGPQNNGIREERRRRRAREEYSWVSSELDGSRRLSEPPRKRQRSSGAGSNEALAEHCQDVRKLRSVRARHWSPIATESSQRLERSTFHGQDSCQWKSRSSGHSQELSSFETGFPSLLHNAEQVNRGLEQNEEVTMAIANPNNKYFSSYEPMYGGADVPFDEQPVFQQSQTTYDPSYIALSDPDIPLPSVEVASETLELTSHGRSCYRERDDSRTGSRKSSPISLDKNEVGCLRVSGNAEPAGLQKSNHLSLDENGVGSLQHKPTPTGPQNPHPISLDNNAVCERGALNTPPQRIYSSHLSQSNSLPLSILHLANPGQRSCIQKIITDTYASPYSPIETPTTPHCPYQIPSDLRSLFERLEKKFSTDEPFRRSSLTWLLEKMSARAGQVDQGSLLSLPEDGQFYTSETINMMMHNAHIASNLEAAELRNRLVVLQHGLNEQTAALRRAEQDNKKMAEELMVLRERAQGFNQDANFYFLCDIDVSNGKKCCALNQHYYMNGNQRFLREKCVLCKKKNINFKTRLYISHEHAGALQQVGSREQAQHGSNVRLEENPTQQQARQPANGRLSYGSAQSHAAEHQRYLGQIPATSMLYTQQPFVALAHQHGSALSDSAQSIPEQSFDGMGLPRWQNNAAIAGNQQGPVVFPNSTQLSEVTGPLTEGSCRVSHPRDFTLPSTQFGHNSVYSSSILHLPQVSVNENAAQSMVRSYSEPMAQPSSFDKAVPQGTSHGSEMVPTSVRYSGLTLPSTNKRAAPGGHEETLGLAHASMAVPSTCVHTTRLNKRARAASAKLSKSKAFPARERGGYIVSQATTETLRLSIPGTLRPWMTLFNQNGGGIQTTTSTSHQQPIDLTKDDDEARDTGLSSPGQTSDSSSTARSSPLATTEENIPSPQPLQGVAANAHVGKAAIATESTRKSTNAVADTEATSDNAIMEELFGDDENDLNHEDAEYELDEDHLEADLLVALAEEGV